MSNRLVIDSSDLRAGLRQLRESVAGSGEAGHLIEAAGNAAVVAIRSGYPSRSGELRDKVQVTHRRDAFGGSARVVSGSKYAAAFEYGSQVRHTKIGANRGAMPARPVFTPVMARERRSLTQALTALLVRHGLVVTGG